MVNGDSTRLYRAVVDEAANGGQVIMEALIRASRRALHDREADAKTSRDRQSLTEARQYLNKYESVMVDRYAAALRSVFDAGGSSFHPKALHSVHFDQLELMDETQIIARVELARAEQIVVLGVAKILAEFNSLMCAAAGLATVRAGQHAVKPESFALALQTVVSSLQLPVTPRDHLMGHLSEALGQTLAEFYAKWTVQLRAQGVQPAGYAVRPNAAWFDFGDSNSGGDAGAPVAASSSTQDIRLQQLGVARRAPAVQDQSLLTLNKLRQLLAGEFDLVGLDARPLTFGDQFSKDFEAALDVEGRRSFDFTTTVPAAFEALKEMQQVEHVMARIGTRTADRAISVNSTAEGGLDETRATLRKSAKGLGQALSLEVVSLMVDNLAQDERLLVPVQDVIRNLEPALLRLALVDPRFFSDKEHPARRLLQEITQRSLAFGVVGAVGSSIFIQFFQPLQAILRPLSEMPIDSAQPFELALKALTSRWDEQRQKRDAQVNAAVQALQRIEDRNLLAEEVAVEILAQPDARKTPAGVVEFLCGPWAQVIAHASLADNAGAQDPGSYRELVRALIWSAQPELTSQKIGKLTRLVPKLLSKLREGLALIDYPALKTSVFFELLMNLHQQAFRPPVQVKEVPQPGSDFPVWPQLAEHWVAPDEAKASGFMKLPLALAQTRSLSAQPTERMPLAVETTALSTTSAASVQVSPDFVWPLGSWVEICVNEVWMRTQLSWASPHGTLFLFTSATGSTQSMTRRLRDQLIAAGTMRVISSQTVVDGALDAVAQTAMNNSVDVSL